MAVDSCASVLVPRHGHGSEVGTAVGHVGEFGNIVHDVIFVSSSEDKEAIILEGCNTGALSPIGEVGYCGQDWGDGHGQGGGGGAGVFGTTDVGPSTDEYYFLSIVGFD